MHPEQQIFKHNNYCEDVKTAEDKLMQGELLFTFRLSSLNNLAGAGQKFFVCSYLAEGNQIQRRLFQTRSHSGFSECYLDNNNNIYRLTRREYQSFDRFLASILPKELIAKIDEELKKAEKFNRTEPTETEVSSAPPGSKIKNSDSSENSSLLVTGYSLEQQRKSTEKESNGDTDPKNSNKPNSGSMKK